MARLEQLSLTQFRCFDRLQWVLTPGFNAVLGANAAGKTAIVEALWLLATGRSFRTARLHQVIRHGQQQAVVFAQVDGHRLGWSRTAQDTVLRLNGETVHTQAKLSARLPLQLLTPESHRLLEEGPRLRRQYLDWGGFYHFAEFMTHWRNWRRALKQRNHALRQGQPPAAVRIWDGLLVEHGEALDRLRRAYLDEITPCLQRFLAALLPEIKVPVSVHYRSGWKQELTLAEALAESSMRDMEQRTTTVGPHRADVRFRFGGVEAEVALSRGQQKLFVCALLLAQAEAFRRHHGRSVVMLIDDLPAELDADHRAHLLALLAEHDIQHVVTATDAALLPGVEQANILQL